MDGRFGMTMYVHEDVEIEFGYLAGQIAGAFYGFSTINQQFLDWLSRPEAL